MIFNSDSLDSQKISDLLLSIVVPRPIAIVTSLNPNDSGVNIAPFSLFNLVSLDPPVVYVSILKTNPPKRTATNIKAAREFVISIPNFDVADNMNKAANHLSSLNVNKFEFCGLTEAASRKIKTPGVKECLMRIECTLHSIMDFGNFEMLLGNIINVFCDDAILDNTQVSIEKHEFISRLGPKELYAKINLSSIFKIIRDGVNVYEG